MDKITHTPTPIWICKKCFGQFTENVNPHTKAEWFQSGKEFSTDTDVCDNPLERYISLDELHKQIGMALTHWVRLKTINHNLREALEDIVNSDSFEKADAIHFHGIAKDALKAADGEGV